jgi:Polyketide cyclase / dehydrase and lipid transport
MDERRGTSQTSSQLIGHDPDAVWQLLTDATHLPAWAPDFADSVVPDGDGGWEATKGDREFALRVPTNAEARTVDYLRTGSSGVESGAYLRVTPMPAGGCLVAMTLPFAVEVDLVPVKATLRSELSALAALADRLLHPR